MSRPLTDNAPYDLIVDIEGKLHKVQIKSRKVYKGVISVEIFTSMYNYKKFYSAEDFDILVVHNSETDELAMVDWGFIGSRTTIKLRCEATKNNQKHGVTFFSDYKL